MPDLDLYDSINTMAARWLMWNSRERKQPLGIKDFKRKNKIHLWLLYIMNSFSITAGYEDFYLDCSWFDYLYIRYIKRMRHVKKMNGKTDVFLIESELFAKEICECFEKDADFVQYIYDMYWG